jgi:hypothetical protein
VETQLERKIKAVQSDNGKEYCNKEMDKFFRDSGIQRRLTTVYSPQQNGLAERKNRMLVEAARCMLLESGLPASFWGEAIMTANHVRNSCISKSIDGDIPYKRWTGKSPDVSHLQIFGCKAYVLDKPTNRGKFDSKTVEGIFVGYSDYPKGYRMWIPSEQKIRISRDVKFLEEFESNEYEDIISSETLNGRFKLSDVLGNMDPSGRVDIDICGGENGLEETKAPTVNMQEIPLMQEDFEEDKIAGEIVTPDEEIEKMDDAIKTKRGPGRPRKILSGKVRRPKKQYHMIYNQNVPVVVDSSNIEPTSNEDPRYEEIDFVMTASEICLSQAGYIREILKRYRMEDCKPVLTPLAVGSKLSANCEIDRRSYTGSTFILSGAAFSWESRKQRTVALSSTEAEYMALSDASKEAVFLIGYLKELGFQSLANVVVFNDNQGAGKLTENSVYHARSKHIDVRFYSGRSEETSHQDPVPTDRENDSRCTNESLTQRKS